MSQGIRSLSLSLLSMTILGCAQLSQLQSVGVVGHEFDPRVGINLELKESLAVPSGTIEAWFDPFFYQTAELSPGALLKFSRLRDGVKCGIRLAKPVPRGGEDVAIEPGIFTVTRVVRESSPLGINPATVSMHENFATDVTLSYRVDVSSVEQPQVAAFFCSQRYASLTRQDLFPSAVELKKQARGKLLWP